MDRLLKSISYIFHPLLMPFLGVLFYFIKSPRFITIDTIQVKLVAVFILTIVLPSLLFLLLKTQGNVKSVNLETTKERVFPLFINCGIILLVIKRILLQTEVIELYYFFIGILISTIACLVLALIKFKASIHMIAISGLFMYFIALSIHFSININGTLAFIAIIIGATATSRLILKAHTPRELIMGIFIGLTPQLILLRYWL